MIALDIDGTLLTTWRAVLPSTVDALRRSIDAGHVVALASSRPPESVRRIASEVSARVAPLITLNGAFMVIGEREIEGERMSADDLASVVAVVRERGLHASVYVGWDWYVERDDRWGREEAEIVGFGPRRVDAFEAILHRGAHKALVIGEPSEVDAFIALASERAPGVETARSKPHYCEVMRRGVSKVQAIEAAAEILGLTMADVVAFGDGENDAGMIAAAGVGVAMGNSFESALAAADMVTAGNDEDGIAKALAALGL